LTFKQLKKHITLLTDFLPCPAARVPVTSSRHWSPMVVVFAPVYGSKEDILSSDNMLSERSLKQGGNVPN